MNNIKKIIIYIVSVIGLVALDQFTKYLAILKLKGKHPFVIIDGVFEFSYLQNDGAAWGMMSGGRAFFIVSTIIIVAVLEYVMFELPIIKKHIWTFVILTMLTAGAIGNFIDRLMYGYVNDFIYFKLINFPVFNVADMYVTVSVAIFIFLIFFVYKDDDFDFLKIWRKNGTN